MSVRECTQCSAQTKRGTRCTRRTCKYYEYCFQHQTAGVAVKKSTIPRSGMGLFATKDFKAKQKIVSYAPKGKLVTRSEYAKNQTNYGIDVGKNKILDGASTQSGLGRYANACQTGNQRSKQCRANNAKLTVNTGKQQASIVANRPIKKGQEIFVAYGAGFYKR